MKKTLYLLPLLIALLTGCKKEGCTDKDAENFDPKAKSDNHTCTYEGSAVLWYGQSTSAGLITSGVTSLKYFVDGQLIGSTSSDVYFTGAPDCGQNGSITITRNLGSVKGKTYQFRVEDQIGRQIWEGFLNLEGGKCVQQELVL